MKEFLKKDLTIKIFSIVFAIFLWFMINPVKTNYYTVPLNVINEDSLTAKGLVLNNKTYQKYAVVSVRDRGDVLDTIKDTDFEVTLDLSKVKSVDDKVVPLEPPVYLGREKIDSNNISLKPKSITLDLEKIEENPFSVQIEAYGKLPEGYEIISKTAVPNTVTIEAVDSVLNNVGSVKAFVDITGLNKSLQIRKECKVYDKNGEELPELSKKLTVDLKIEIGKRVPVIPITEGTPAADYIEGSYIVKPDKVLVTSDDADKMASFDEIKTEPISLDKANKTFTAKTLLQLPDGLKLVSSTREVNVTVQIIPLEKREFIIPSQNLSINGKKADNTLTYELTGPVTIMLKGKKEDLDKVSIPDLLANIDVGALDEGTHNVPLKVILPTNISQVDDVLVPIKVTKGV